MSTTLILLVIGAGILAGAIAGFIAYRRNAGTLTGRPLWVRVILTVVAVLVIVLLVGFLLGIVIPKAFANAPAPTQPPAADSSTCGGVNLATLPVLPAGMNYVCTADKWEVKGQAVQAPVDGVDSCGGVLLSSLPTAPTGFKYVCTNSAWTFAPTGSPIIDSGSIASGDTTLFGSGSCTIAGSTYVLKADTSAVWMDPDTQKVLSESGGQCDVTTNKQGWYWSVGDGTITHDGINMERGNAFIATPGSWTFKYDAPAAGTRNESLGLKFRDNLPRVEDQAKAFGTGTCTIGGKNYSVAFDSTAVWLDDELNRQLWNNGGTCTVTTTRPGWYWSITGSITLDGKIMANGQRLIAPAGTWTFEYAVGGYNDSRGFILRDNVPFGQ